MRLAKNENFGRWYRICWIIKRDNTNVPITYADTSDLENDFGYKPSTSLRDGLREFGEWYKECFK